MSNTGILEGDIRLVTTVRQLQGTLGMMAYNVIQHYAVKIYKKSLARVYVNVTDCGHNDNVNRKTVVSKKKHLVTMF